MQRVFAQLQDYVEGSDCDILRGRTPDHLYGMRES